MFSGGVPSIGSCKQFLEEAHETLWSANNSLLGFCLRFKIMESPLKCDVFKMFIFVLFFWRIQKPKELKTCNKLHLRFFYKSSLTVSLGDCSALLRIRLHWKHLTERYDGEDIFVIQSEVSEFWSSIFVSNTS